MPTNICGTGGWSGPQPGDPDNNVALSAAPVFGGIQIFWTYPATNPYAVAHTLLYRGSSSDFQSAIQIGVVAGNRFFDQIYGQSSITYYYWIQLVSVNGTVGATVGPAVATYQPTISQIIEDLSSQIDEGLLAQALRTKIDQITLNYQQIQAEIADRLADNAAYSALMAQLQDDIDGAITVITTEITNRVDGDNALVSQLNVLGAANADNAALIASETSARVSADEALAEQIDIVAALTDSNAAAIISEESARVTGDSANASQITQLSSTVTLNNTNALAAASTAQTAADNAQTSANTANALLTDLSADDKLTPTEKQQVRKEWDAVVAEKAGINSQAGNYGITTANTLYNDSYLLLDRYLLGTTAITSGNTAGTVTAGSAILTSLTTTTNLDKSYTPAGGSATASGAGFRLIWADFYKNRQALLNTIHAQAKILADAAQGTANTAVTNAATAQGTANTASTNATSALNQLTDISADDKWTPVEKQQIKLEWDGVVAEKSGINTQGTSYGLTAQNTAYDNAYLLLNQYLNATAALTNAAGTVSAGSNLLSSLTTTTNLDKTYTPAGGSATTLGAGCRKVFADFYAARQALLNAIYAQAKVLADAAQNKANSVESSLLTNYYTKAEFNSAVSNATITAQVGTGGTLGSVSQSLTAHLNGTNGKVNDIGARYTVTVDVNGQVGGFAIYNNGTTVEAGFNVDKFWIGTTNANRKKPFIITGGVVYIDNAMITNLGADKINTNGLIVRDGSGNAILGSGTALASGYVGAGTGTNLLGDGSFLGGNIDANIGYYTTSGAPVLAHNLSADYTLQGEGTLYLHKSGFVANGAVFDANFTALGAVPCVAGERFEISALLNPHRCSGVVICLFLNSSGVQVGGIFGNTVGQIGATTRLLANFTASRVIATAPANATQAYLVVRATGLGLNDPYLFISRAYIGRATISQSEYSPWSNGGGIKRINSGNASTYIADLAVNTLQIAGSAVTIPQSAIGTSSSGGGPAVTINNAIAGQRILLLAFWDALSTSNIATDTVIIKNADGSNLKVDTQFARITPIENNSAYFSDFSGISMMAIVTPGSDGNYTYYLTSAVSRGASFYAVQTKR